MSLDPVTEFGLTTIPGAILVGVLGNWSYSLITNLLALRTARKRAHSYADSLINNGDWGLAYYSRNKSGEYIFRCRPFTIRRTTLSEWAASRSVFRVSIGESIPYRSGNSNVDYSYNGYADLFGHVLVIRSEPSIGREEFSEYFEVQVDLESLLGGRYDAVFVGVDYDRKLRASIGVLANGPADEESTINYIISRSDVSAERRFLGIKRGNSTT